MKELKEILSLSCTKGNIPRMKAYISSILIKLTVILTAFFTPIQHFLLVIGFTVMLDAAVAIYAVIKTEGQEAVQSKRLKDTAIKSLMYFLVMCTARSVEMAFDIEFASKIMGSYLIITEMKSIDEKWFKVYGKSLFNVIIQALPDMNKQKNKSNKDA
jgi:hypothetical protein